MKGGASATGPLVGTATYDLYLFQRQYTVPSRNPTPTSTPTPTQTPAPPKKKTNTTAIIAIYVLGGIVLLIAAISSFVLLRKRQTKNKLGLAE